MRPAAAGAVRGVKLSAVPEKLSAVPDMIPRAALSMIPRSYPGRDPAVQGLIKSVSPEDFHYLTVPRPIPPAAMPGK